jgi:endonuclease VIII
VPEGDTLFRTAARLRPALAGHALTRFEAMRLVGDRPRIGTRIDDVEARGKHLLVHFDGGLTLRTHLRMTGSWHIYRDGERWRKGVHLARAVVGADSGWVAVCFQAPVVETYHRVLGDPVPLASLGPDLCVEASLNDEVLDTVLERVAALTDDRTQVGEALLDQRIAAGVGNVYKSEVCFACGVDPFTAVADLDAAAGRRLWDNTARQLRANLERASRITWGDGQAVYGRRGQPCPRCGTPVRAARQGEQARVTYWCPSCQARPDRPRR